MRRFLFGALAAGAIVAAVYGDDVRKKTGAKVYDLSPARTSTAATMSTVWLGVRVAPVPDALEAHLGHGGLMIGNVFKNTPADTAGLQRFDVLVSINGTDIHEMGDLVSALDANGEGKAANLVVQRGGKEVSVEITPTKRPERGSNEFKFDEPQGDSGDARSFAHRLERDPGTGQWLMRPLGPIQMPDWLRQDVQGLDDAPWNDLMKDFRALQDPFMLDVQTDPDNPNSFILRGQNDGNANVEINISQNKDGEKISVHKGADGKITVDRTDTAGATSSRQFDNSDELRDQDPDAFKLLSRTTGVGARALIATPPSGMDLPALQKDFQSRVERAFRDSRDRMDKAMADAKRNTTGGQSLSTSRSVSIQGENGRLHVTVVRDGQKTEYDFDSPESFKAKEPELYEEFKGMLGE